MKTKVVVFGMVLLMGSASIFAQDLSGVWNVGSSIGDNDKRIVNMSWGDVVFSRNSNQCIAIDWLGERGTFYIGGQGKYTIRKIVEISEGVYALTFNFSRGNFDITCTIHLMSKNEFWIEPIEGITLFATGSEKVYQRLSSPNDTIK